MNIDMNKAIRQGPKIFYGQQLNMGLECDKCLGTYEARFVFIFSHILIINM